MSTIMATGTVEDKISALTLAVQESPLHHIKAFENLVGMGKKKSRNHALMALAAVKDMLSQGLALPSDRKLVWFGAQPMLWAALETAPRWTPGQPLPGGLQDVHLIVWAFEDWLKKSYFELIKTLETWCSDEIEYSRARALTFIFELLKDKPEQEENLLRLLVNKLGDKTRKVASRASYLLLQLQEAHPNMKETVVKAMEADILFRPGQTINAKYYASITLNQTVLSSKEPALAKKLLEVYFAVFKSLLKSDRDDEPTKQQGKLNRKALKRLEDQEKAHAAEGQTREKMTAQILTGINRAFPFADLTASTFDAQLDTLYRVTHSSNFNTSVQALMLIQMITQTNSITSDRYYRTLYESLLDPRLVSSSKQILYLNLLYRSLKADNNVKRVQAFIKRILQFLSVHEAPFVCSALYLIGEILMLFPSIKSMFSEPESNEDEEERYVDVEEEGQTALAQVNGSETPKYDARKRDPLFANADRSCLWEILQYQAHFHPSVALFAERLLLGEKMPQKPDPTLHTLIHFLDRFMYKNAKAKTAVRGASIMQPLTLTNGADLLISERSGASTEAPLNTESFWNKKVGDVAVDEVFFHQYFSHTVVKSKKAKKDTRAAAEDDDADDEQENQIWKALVDSRPDIEGDGDEEGFSDMEELMAEDDSGDDSGDEAGAFGADAFDQDEDLAELVDSEEDDVELNLDSDVEEAPEDEEAENSDIDLDSEDGIMGSDEEIPEEVEAPLPSSGKDKGRRKLKQLPLFASFEDYEKLIGDDDDE
jgi:ribosome biogenesis protein MAK21